MNPKAEIAVVGGGVAGSTIALYLTHLGLDVTLFEKGSSLVDGPPMCHLHAGGNLYREISDEQCLQLLKESIELVQFYPDAVDYRPTVIAVPCEDEGEPEQMFERLHFLQAEYEKLIVEDSANEVLGKSSDYFKLYSREAVDALRVREAVSDPQTADEWMIPVVKHIDLDRVKFPLVLVQEYGLNIFRLAASMTLALQQQKKCTLLLNHQVVDAKKDTDDKYRISYEFEGKKAIKSFDFLINAAGFRSGQIDDFLGFTRERLVEFKAAYVSQLEGCSSTWPEVVFHGKRGTPQGMAQFTPYPGGYFQLHGMTKDITLFDEGLVKSTHSSSHPILNLYFMDKIQKNWTFQESKPRSEKAIEHLGQYIPMFHRAQAVSKPLYGAQQIPGKDATLRATEVSFENEHYARCEIVKVSSVVGMADAITKQLVNLGLVDKGAYKRRFTMVKDEVRADIDSYAHTICKSRDYPQALAKRIKDHL
jgi:glycine/D-amino acid oxidase-like deaminating enzyme